MHIYRYCSSCQEECLHNGQTRAPRVLVWMYLTTSRRIVTALSFNLVTPPYKTGILRTRNLSSTAKTAFSPPSLESPYLLKHICLLDYELWTFVSGPSFIYYPWLKTYYIPARPRLLHNDCIIIRPWFTLIYQFVPIVPLIHYGIYSITLIADLVKTQ